MFQKRQNLYYFQSLGFVSLDEHMIVKPRQLRFNVNAVTVRKNLRSNAKRPILKTTFAIGCAPQTGEQDREQRICSA
jgi:hypothetical protein